MLQRKRATKEVVAAPEQFATLKEAAAAGTANNDANPGSVVAEARALLEVLETAPLASTTGNAVVPERLLAQMRQLRETLLEHEEDDDDELEPAEHDFPNTGDELEERPAGRCSLRTNSKKRAGSATPARRRAGSSSRTPPPDSVSRRKGG